MVDDVTVASQLIGTGAGIRSGSPCWAYHSFTIAKWAPPSPPAPLRDLASAHRPLQESDNTVTLAFPHAQSPWVAIPQILKTVGASVTIPDNTTPSQAQNTPLFPSSFLPTTFSIPIFNLFTSNVHYFFSLISWAGSLFTPAIMSAFMYTHHHQQQQHPHHGMPSNNHHGRTRRGPKMAQHNAQRQFRGVKSMRELAEAPAVTAFRARFEAGRSFDLDDDLEFCPNLLTDEDVCCDRRLRSLSPVRSFLPSSGPLEHRRQNQESPPETSLLTNPQLHSIHSASSDRSSLSSGSPDTSPLQHQIQPVQQVTPSISLSPAQANSYVHGVATNPNHLQYQQQPQANRTRKVIPIVNPNTGMTMTSPPSSISPAMMQTAQRRW